MLERDSEVLALERTFGGLAAGRGAVVVVEAPVGLGKTTLLRRAGDLARAAGFRVLTARGAELEQDFTFGAVRQLLDPVLARQQDARQELFTGAASVTQDLLAGANTDAPAAADEGSHSAPWSIHLLLNGLYWLLRPVLDALSQWGLQHAWRRPLPGEQMHAEHLLRSVTQAIELAADDREPARWHFRLDGADYLAESDGQWWSLTTGVPDRAAGVSVTGTAQGLTTLIFRGSDAEIDIAGEAAAVRRFRELIGTLASVVEPA